MHLVDETVSTKSLEIFFEDEAVIKEILFQDPDALLLGMVSLTVSIGKKNNAFDSSLADETSLEKIFGTTFVSLDQAFQTGGIISGDEKKVAASILATGLNADVKDVEPLVNIATVLLTVSETEGLSSLGVFEDIFSNLIGIEIPAIP